MVNMANGADGEMLLAVAADIIGRRRSHCCRSYGEAAWVQWQLPALIPVLCRPAGQ